MCFNDVVLAADRPAFVALPQQEMTPSRVCRFCVTKSQQSRNAAPMSGNASIPGVGPTLFAFA